MASKELYVVNMENLVNEAVADTSHSKTNATKRTVSMTSSPET